MDKTGYHDNWVLATGVRTHYSWAGTEGAPVVAARRRPGIIGRSRSGAS